METAVKYKTKLDIQFLIEDIVNSLNLIRGVYRENRGIRGHGLM